MIVSFGQMEDLGSRNSTRLMNGPQVSCEMQGHSSNGFLSTEELELSSFLDRAERDSAYIVDEILKDSEFEITQKISAPSSYDSAPPFLIRKYIDLESGLGHAYKMIYEEQQKGTDFTYLPRIYECYELMDKLVVIMEYIQGENLEEAIRRVGASVELAQDVFPRICDAVQELHDKFDPPVIHRDLKPSNIMLSFRRLTLIDFGIARVYRENSISDTRHFGTREFAPPEQFGFGQTDVRSDVYALGLLLFYCLTGKVADLKTRRFHFRHPSVPEALSSIIERACSFDPDSRYQDASYLKSAFMEACTSLKSSDPSRAVRFRCLGSRLQRAPIWLGVIWNVLVLLAWGVFCTACIFSLFVPNDSIQAESPFWYRSIGYLIVMALSCTSITYALLDKRLLFKRFPKLRRMSYVYRFLLFCIGIPMMTMVVFLISTAIVML